MKEENEDQKKSSSRHLENLDQDTSTNDTPPEGEVIINKSLETVQNEGGKRRSKKSSSRHLENPESDQGASTNIESNNLEPEQDEKRVKKRSSKRSVEIQDEPVNPEVEKINTEDNKPKRSSSRRDQKKKR